MTWSERRRFSYAFVTLAIIGLVFYGVYRHVTDVTPSCFDGKRNGDETGVDCGGGCSLYCANDLSDPKVRWVRTFNVTPSIVHAVAYIEQGYPTAASQSASYSFRLYDERNSLITERTGTTYIGPTGKSAIVDTLIPIGNTPVGRVQFAFTSPVRWQKVSGAFATAAIKTDRTTVEHDANAVRVVANLDNQSRFTFGNMEVIAILYDINGNALTASKSILPELPALGNKTVFFTWPYDIKDIARVEIIPRIDPFDSSEL